MLAHSLRRWYNNKPTLGPRVLVFTGICHPFAICSRKSSSWYLSTGTMKIIPVFYHWGRLTSSGVQSQKAVSAHFTSKQILPFGFAEQSSGGPNYVWYGLRIGWGYGHLHRKNYAEIFVYKPWRPKVFFQFEIITNALASSFCLIRIPMIWIYGHQNLLYSFSAEGIYGRQNLTSIDVGFWRLKTVPALKGLKPQATKLLAA